MKMQDPGSFTIPCTIGNVEFKKALCDLGASINLMLLSIVKRLSLGELTSTSMTLQMVDRTTEHREGVLEDVFIKVGKFIFPMDFVVRYGGRYTSSTTAWKIFLGHWSCLDRC